MGELQPTPAPGTGTALGPSAYISLAVMQLARRGAITWACLGRGRHQSDSSSAEEKGCRWFRTPLYVRFKKTYSFPYPPTDYLFLFFVSCLVPLR
jgi:hypothetical protein